MMLGFFFHEQVTLNQFLFSSHDQILVTPSIKQVSVPKISSINSSRINLDFAVTTFEEIIGLSWFLFVLWRKHGLVKCRISVIFSRLKFSFVWVFKMLINALPLVVDGCLLDSVQNLISLCVNRSSCSYFIFSD